MGAGLGVQPIVSVFLHCRKFFLTKQEAFISEYSVIDNV
jgi:hypothetical protein